MIDPNRTNLKELFGVDAEYQNIDAVVDALSDGTPADFGCEIYQTKQGTRYAVVTSKQALPSDAAIISALEHYTNQYPEEYDVEASYTPLEPIKPSPDFKVYRLDPLVKDGE